MHAITLPTFGAPDVMTWAEVPDPVAGTGEVLIAVEAAGVNRADIHQREGHYPPPLGASQILGLECSGRIVDIGPGVDTFTTGDAVCALLAGGAYAELVAVPASQVLPVPTGIVESAALPEAACTVWSTIFEAARLRAGETLLVHGGTSGIGSFAIQLAHALGVRVITTVGTAAKCKQAQELGADLAINYRDDDFVAAAQGVGGADVILDLVGGSYLARNLDALALDGRLVVIATQSGRRAELDFGAVMAKRATIYSAGLRARPLDQKASIVAAVRANVWPLVEAGKVRPVVHATVPMPDAAIAHRLLDADHVGKILLTRPETLES